MSIDFALKADDWQILEKRLADYPKNAENAINNYLHNEGNDVIVHGVTRYIPVSTGHPKAHLRTKGKKYKHKKSGAHAKDAVWYETNKFNLAINLKNIRDYYYLYFVQNGLGTSKYTGGVDFITPGMNSVYDTVLDGLQNALNKEV